MRIVLDLQGAQTASRFRGIGRHTIELTQALVKNRGEHDIFIGLNGLFPDTIEDIRGIFDGLLPIEKILIWKAPGPVNGGNLSQGAHRSIRELMREAFLANLRPDIIHIFSLFEGFQDEAITSIKQFDKSTKISVTMHDLIPFLNPDKSLNSNKNYKKYYMRKIDYLKRADIYLSVSNYSRKKCIDSLGLSENKVVNISSAVSQFFKPQFIDKDAASRLFQKFGIKAPFIFCSGTVEEHKNLERMIQAFAALPSNLQKQFQLVFMGKFQENEIAHLNYLAHKTGLEPEALCFTGYVSDEELVCLYNLCDLFVLPSWHEGFGLPLLEAMSCGAPAIGANTSSIPEVIGQDDALFDPFSINSISKKISEVLLNIEFSKKIREHGLQQSKNFSWDKTAKRAIEEWEKIGDLNSKNKIYNFLSNKRKPRLAYVSPLPPERTGIADYSAELLGPLSEYYEIELVGVQNNTEVHINRSSNKIHNISWLYDNKKNIDRVLYHIGNSYFHSYMLPLMENIPGVVVLHDFFLSGLMSWLELHGGIPNAWTKSLYDTHGYNAVRMRYYDPDKAYYKYPVNGHVLQNALGIIVHSKYSQTMARFWYGNEWANNWKVIPHMRASVENYDKIAIRKNLGFSEKNFIVCSFGFLDRVKLNHRLLKAWLTSELSKDQNCYLIFVGENEGGEYGNELLETISKSSCKDRIRITGFATPLLFSQYLTAADVAVQMRCFSRGETSGTVLDCMNYGLPVIVNAHGAMAELNPQAVWMLPDEFEDMDLISALEFLWRSPERRNKLGREAKEIVKKQHDPFRCSMLYAEAIEGFYATNSPIVPELIEAIASLDRVQATDVELQNIASSINDNHPTPKLARRLFLDVTATSQKDIKTGIERVVRGITLSLLNNPPEGFRIEPVYLTENSGILSYRYARHYSLELLDCPAELDDDLVNPESGDVLLVLDLSPLLTLAEQAGLFKNYRNQGVRIVSLVHDLLPILMPEVFPPGTFEGFANWLKSILNFDGIICVSKKTSMDLIRWQYDVGIQFKNSRILKIDWFHLGADLLNSSPSRGLPENAQITLQQLKNRPSFLMVGTIEPRKGYLQTIEAFSQLWHENIDVNLVIVGKEGWNDLPNSMRRNIPETIECLNNHPEKNKRLFWLQGISDEYLESIYSNSSCLIAASYDEGFGLPLIEAANHNLPIFARDIKIFREIAGSHAFYFNASTPGEFAQAVKIWLSLFLEKRAPISVGLPILTWEESAHHLLKILADWGFVNPLNYPS